MERVPQRPLLPADLVALQREVRPLRLLDLQRLQRRPQRANLLEVEVVKRLGRDGDFLDVKHFDDLLLVHVDQGNNTLDDAGIGVGGIAAQVRDGADQARSLQVGAIDEPGRPGLQRHLVELLVIQAAFPHRLLPAFVFSDDLTGPGVLLDKDVRLDALAFDERADRLPPQVDDGFEGATGRSVQDDNERLARERIAWLVFVHNALEWLVQGDEREERVLPHLGRGAEEIDGAADLFGRQRIERVRIDLPVAADGGSGRRRRRGGADLAGQYQQTDSEFKEDEQAERRTNQKVHWRTDREKEPGPRPTTWGIRMISADPWGSKSNTVEIGASHSLLLPWVCSGPKLQGGYDSHATRTVHAAAR